MVFVLFFSFFAPRIPEIEILPFYPALFEKYGDRPSIRSLQVHAPELESCLRGVTSSAKGPKVRADEKEIVTDPPRRDVIDIRRGLDVIDGGANLAQGRVSEDGFPCLLPLTRLQAGIEVGSGRAALPSKGGRAVGAETADAIGGRVLPPCLGNFPRTATIVFPDVRQGIQFPPVPMYEAALGGPFVIAREM